MTMNRRRFVQAAGVGAGLGLTGAGWAFHDGPLVQPSYGEISNLEILGYCDMGFGDQPDGSALDPVSNLPWDRTSEFRVVRGYAYCANYQGFSIVDVRDPRNMRSVFRYQHNPVANNTQYIDIKGGNILVQKQNDNLRIWDVSNPYAPVQLSTFAPADIAGGYHGMWVHEDHRGRFAFASCSVVGYTGNVVIIVDITDPRRPREASRWWYPGQGPGETPTWPAGISVTCHDLTTYKDRCYAAWRDKGLIILDISNISNPVRVGELNWADGRPNMASLPGQTHSWGIVVPKHGGRAETVVSGDELSVCPYGFFHFVDVRNESKPREISNFMLPLNMHGNCPPDRPGRRMGTHDIERMIRGDIAWSAWEEGGFWGIDISDIHNPKQIAYFIPPVRSDSLAFSGHADDVFVMDDGLIFGSSSDFGAGGLWAMRFKKKFKETVVWNADESNVIVTRDRHGRHDNDD